VQAASQQGFASGLLQTCKKKSFCTRLEYPPSKE
jgi:hypothetical protein